MSLPKGQETIERLLQEIGEKAGENGQAESMGEGSNRMLQNMMM